MGRPRGRLTTQIHALVDACGLPILLKITEGQAHDGPGAQDMLGSLGRGNVLLGDRGYDSDALWLELATRGARANVRLMPNRVNLPPFNKRHYRKRNLVERFFNKLRHFPAIATRYDKRDDNYLASIKPASARIWMRFNESMAWDSVFCFCTSSLPVRRKRQLFFSAMCLQWAYLLSGRFWDWGSSAWLCSRWYHGRQSSRACSPNRPRPKAFRCGSIPACFLPSWR